MKKKKMWNQTELENRKSSKQKMDAKPELPTDLDGDVQYLGEGLKEGAW